MPTPKTPQRVRLDELLADGAWHDREPLISAAAAAVPPGVAARHATRARAAYRAKYARWLNRHGLTPRPAVGGAAPADDVRVGARALADIALRSAVRTGAYQQRALRDGTVRYRLTPRGGE